MKPRLSMKLLYEFRGDYLSSFGYDTEAQEQAMTYTARFLAFVDKQMKAREAKKKQPQED